MLHGNWGSKFAALKSSVSRLFRSLPCGRHGGLALALAACVTTTAARADDFVNFESSQVHPVALSADGQKLFALNTPDARLAIFAVAADGSLTLSTDVPVGIDPVSLALHGSEAWVVNHVSDSISVVDTATGRLVDTIATDDEPTDIVFAGDRAFVSLAGRHNQVLVYDAATRSQVGQVDIFGDDPRALAVSQDGSEVYLVVLESGNLTSVVHAVRVKAGGGAPPPSPPKSPTLPAAPATALIVKFDANSENWVDETGKAWFDANDLLLPDQDLFVIDASTLALSRTVSTLGTTLFNVAVQPGSGDLWVANTEALNQVRFEPNLRGHFIDTRMTVVQPGAGTRHHVDLNPHVNFAVTPGPAEERDQSLAIPGDTRFSADGATAYVAAFGSSAVGVIDTATGAIHSIAVGGGPTGLALDEARQRLYVLDRFDNTISVVDTAAGRQVSTIGLAGPSFFDPTPERIREGRRLLYDAKRTSGHGESACASCHVFGNVDGLGWDLGDPTGTFVPYAVADWVSFQDDFPSTRGFHPMKGPMVTQTLRGLAGLEPFHWRGDRREFGQFNGAFVSLMGLDAPLSSGDMELFTDFALSIRMPPNPFRNLDDTLPPTIAVPALGGNGSLVEADPSRGEDLYRNGLDADGTRNCITCHPIGTGTDGRLNTALALLDAQDIKIAQLRNMYEKSGLRRQVIFGDGVNVGASMQEAGFGVLHDGASSLSEFLIAYFLRNSVGVDVSQDMNAFLMAFPTGTPPVVGHQLTVDRTSALSPDTDALVARMIDQAAAGNCDLVVHGTLGAEPVGFVYDPSSSVHRPDSRNAPSVGDAALRSSLVDGDHLTYTAVPFGSGVRLGIDRDRDSWRDRDEAAGGSDAADPASFPASCTTNAEASLTDASLRVSTDVAAFATGKLSASGSVSLVGRDSPPIDLAASGITLVLRDSAGQALLQRWLPASAWRSPKDGAWNWRDKAGSLAPGITRASVRATGGVYRFDVRGRGLGAEIAPSAFPLTMLVVFGAADQEAAGQCGRLAIPAAGCKNFHGTLSCRG